MTSHDEDQQMVDVSSVDQSEQVPVVASDRVEKEHKEFARKTQNLTELLMLMDNYSPVIPDAVTDYYLAKSGFQTDDVRLKRLMGLAAQKFVSDIASDAFAYAKLKQQGQTAKERKTAAAASKVDKKMVLTMEDLSAALSDQGVNLKRPDFYV